MCNRRYVLITAARNEERYIGKTLASVASQNLRPVRWIVVSDASTDRTDEIVRGYAERFEFIELLRLDGSRSRDFAGKVHALSAGYERLRRFDFQYVGNLDADISLDSDYFERLVSRFEEDPGLGIAGGDIRESVNGQFLPRATNSVRSVAHAVHFLRRQCYEDIGGYIPLPYGGEDWAANVTARMRGWRVQSFPDLSAFHHRCTGTAGGVLRYMFRQGLMDSSFGSHLAFEVVKCIRRMPRHPLGATARLLGFTWATVSGKPHLVSRELVEFLRSEQKSRLLALFQAPFLRRARRATGITQCVASAGSESQEVDGQAVRPNSPKSSQRRQTVN